MTMSDCLLNISFVGELMCYFFLLEVAEASILLIIIITPAPTLFYFLSNCFGKNILL